MKVLAVIVLVKLFLAPVILLKTLSGTPAGELRRRARTSSGTASLYQLASFGPSAELFLWTVAAGSLVGLGFVAADSSTTVAVAVVAGLLLVTWFIPPLRGGPLRRYSALIARPVAAAVSILHPALLLFTGSRSRGEHTRVYES